MGIDLEKLANNYYEAAKTNILEANQFIRVGQGWLLAVAMAEFAFVGQLLIISEKQNISLDISSKIKLMLIGVGVFILLCFIVFFIGVYFQVKHSLKVFRDYYKLNKKVAKYAQENNKKEVKFLPQQLNDDNIERGKTNKWANIFFIFSFSFLMIASLILILAVIFVFI
jgi:hypothetical protein